ncbi:neuronal acetylcholine receptor subunit alpha-10-like [Saccostrea echinata]|uniref:neuronal acetylcholine receptor subunit alpha-10-like n=1 Tax=Saccostrea echinata TaxID=191078 RepID=UPI002A829F15|nr:neuronal acetylcholine receptor subunit alpha-10-like [Saccostrea echinata]
MTWVLPSTQRRTYLIIRLVIDSYDVCSTEAKPSTIEQSLYSSLLSNYTTEILPRCNHTTNITVNLDIALREIIALNEREQTLKLKMWIRQSWKDCGLAWTPATYGGLTSFSVSMGKLWTPDITLFESAHEGENMPGRGFYRITVYSDGSAYFNFPTVVEMSCSVDVTYFPYDTQKCTITLGSWTYNGQEVDLVARRSTGDLSSFVKSNEWEVISFRSERHVLYYGCCPEPFPDVTFYLQMKRKPKFYVLTIIFPCTLVLALAALGFIIPADSGEKVSLEVTVLLSLSVFLLLVSDKLPASAETFPIIGVYFSVCMIIVCLSCTFAVWVLYLHFRGESTSPVPSWVRRLFLGKLRFILCPTTKVGFVDKKPGMGKNKDDVKVENIDSLSVCDGSQETGTHDDMGAEERLEEWRALARVLDRLFFIFYMVISPTVTIVFFGILVNQ